MKAKPEKKERTPVLHIRGFSLPLRKRLKAAAAQRGIPLYEVIEMACIAWLKEQRKAKT